MKKWGAMLLMLLMISCCGAGEQEIWAKADLRQGMLSVYCGEKLLSEQPLAISCAVLPLGEWVVTAQAEGVCRLSCPWGAYYLDALQDLPVGTRVQVSGAPVVVSCQAALGERGPEIWRMQQGLYELGYLDAEPTGRVDERTLAAIHALRFTGGSI